MRNKKTIISILIGVVLLVGIFIMNIPIFALDSNTPVPLDFNYDSSKPAFFIYNNLSYQNAPTENFTIGYVFENFIFGTNVKSDIYVSFYYSNVDGNLGTSNMMYGNLLVYSKENFGWFNCRFGSMLNHTDGTLSSNGAFVFGSNKTTTFNGSYYYATGRYDVAGTFVKNWWPEITNNTNNYVSQNRYRRIENNATPIIRPIATNVNNMIELPPEPETLPEITIQSPIDGKYDYLPENLTTLRLDYNVIANQGKYYYISIQKMNFDGTYTEIDRVHTNTTAASFFLKQNEFDTSGSPKQWITGGGIYKVAFLSDRYNNIIKEVSFGSEPPYVSGEVNLNLKAPISGKHSYTYSQLSQLTLDYEIINYDSTIHSPYTIYWEKENNGKWDLIDKDENLISATETDNVKIIEKIGTGEQQRLRMRVVLADGTTLTKTFGCGIQGQDSYVDPTPPPGSGWSDDWNFTEMPVPPTKPTDGDILAWIGFIGEFIAYLFKLIGWALLSALNYIIQAIVFIADSCSTLFAMVNKLFSFLPIEFTTILLGGLALAVVLKIFKK